jgi:hypothetical protein
MSTVVWSVNIIIGVGLAGVVYALYLILTLDAKEGTSDSYNHKTPHE